MTPVERTLAHFAEISAFPRASKNEARLRAWLQAWARAQGWASAVDAAGNLVIRVPGRGSPGSSLPLILQGHLDMVCQKAPDSDHDFSRDPIRLVREGDWIRADGTTLGADNGIAPALMMALAEDEALRHPPLELLLTVEEEGGMGGADHLDPALLTGKTLINLDSEEEGVFTIGCAGGGGVTVLLPVTWGPPAASEAAVELKVSGLRGGHSGEDIGKLRANAGRVMARLLDGLQREVPLRLSRLQGGTARTAIPRQAAALLVVSHGQVARCDKALAELAATLRAEHAQTEPRLNITWDKPTVEPVSAISPAETAAGLWLLRALPNGVAAMSAEFPGLVETSSNLGVVELRQDGLSIVSGLRSAVWSRLEEIAQQVEAVAWLAGATARRTKLFPPWRANPASPLLARCVETYTAALGTTPKVTVAHGGLECGLISDRCGGLDTISLGPTIENPHTPDERLFVPALARTWAFLAACLERQANIG